MADNTSDVQAVQRAQEFFRLKQPVTSPGSVYELNESLREIYIGPDSDIAEVMMTYFDPTAADGSSLSTATVSVNGPFVGRVDSLPLTQVPNTNQPARILLAPNDIVDNTYIPPNSAAYRRFNIPAIIDVIVALQKLSSIPAVRADRTLRFAQVPYQGQPVGMTDGSTDLLVPFYGRRMATVTLVAPQAVIMTVALVTLLPGSPTIPRSLGSVLTPVTIPPTMQSRSVVVRASDAARQGVNYDAAGTTIAGNYVESDQPDGLPATANSPQVRGLADLLLVNVKNNGVAAPGIRYCDVFIKVSDRET
jgi:hypothetical protein